MKSKTRYPRMESIATTLLMRLTPIIIAMLSRWTIRTASRGRLGDMAGSRMTRSGDADRRTLRMSVELKTPPTSSNPPCPRTQRSTICITIGSAPAINTCIFVLAPLPEAMCLVHCPRSSLFSDVLHNARNGTPQISPECFLCFFRCSLLAGIEKTKERE